MGFILALSLCKVYKLERLSLAKIFCSNVSEFIFDSFSDVILSTTNKEYI